MKCSLPLTVFFCLVSPVWPSDQPRVSYEVSLARRADHHLDVRMEISGIEPGDIELAIPAWNNLYRIRDFARFVTDLQATGRRGSRLDVGRVDKQTWRVFRSADDPVVVTYSAYAAEPGSFSAEVGERHAFVNPALVFLYVPEHRDLPHQVKFLEVPAGWRIATGLDSDAGIYRASSYDHLIDCPFELGGFDQASFEYRGVLYEIVMDGRLETPQLGPFQDMVRQVVSYQVDFMGTVPFQRYVFIFHFADEGSGGMEHRNSTAIGLARSAVAGRAGSGITAHEFFHLWNGKRIRPMAFDELDLSREVYTRSLWFSEGTTSYYSLLTLVRSGLISKEEFYEEIAKQIQTLCSRPARLRQSVEEASLQTWFDNDPFYRRPENSVSYYNKGALISLLLDLEIRSLTHNRRSLDDVLRFMNVWFGDRDQGFAEGDIQRAVESISQSDFDSFFERYVSGTAELPLKEALEWAGLSLHEEAGQDWSPGFSVAAAENGVSRVVALDPQSPAFKAGLRLGDQVVSVQGRPPADFPGLELPNADPSRPIELSVRRGDHLEGLSFRPEMTSGLTLLIREVESVNPLQESIREGLLTGRPPRVTSFIH